jgi:hypothetical protein
MKRIAVAALLLLSACGTQGSGPEATCEREAENAPEVKELIMPVLVNPNMAYSQEPKISAAKSRARTACLQRLGVLQRGGGVEPVVRPSSLFDGIR